MKMSSCCNVPMFLIDGEGYGEMTRVCSSCGNPQEAVIFRKIKDQGVDDLEAWDESTTEQ